MSAELESLRRRIAALEQEVAALKVAVAPAPRGETGRAAPPLVTTPSPPATSPPPAPPPPASDPPAAPAAGRRDLGDLESQVAGGWFNRIAVVLLVLATLYGFAWAVDNDYIGPGGRVAIGYLAGLVALGAGRYTDGRGYRGWALGVTGGGVAVLYISTYFASQVYGLLPFAAAFGLMVLFTAFSVLLALWYDAVAIAWLGALGGFLTPFLLDTGSRNLVGLFSYTAALDLGILALAWFRPWRSLNALGLLATWAIVGAWVVDYRPPEWGVGFSFATLFFVLFTVAGFLYNLARRQPATARELLFMCWPSPSWASAPPT